MQTRLRNFLMVLLLVGLAGCATSEIGRKFDTAAAQKIEVGKTSESEVLALLGEPLARQVKADGTKLYGYKYIKGQAYFTSPVTMKTKGEADKLVIPFDKQGIVSAVTRASVPAAGGSGQGQKP